MAAGDGTCWLDEQVLYAGEGAAVKGCGGGELARPAAGQSGNGSSRSSSVATKQPAVASVGGSRPRSKSNEDDADELRELRPDDEEDPSKQLGTMCII